MKAMTTKRVYHSKRLLIVTTILICPVVVRLRHPSETGHPSRVHLTETQCEQAPKSKHEGEMRLDSPKRSSDIGLAMQITCRTANLYTLPEHPCSS